MTAVLAVIGSLAVLLGFATAVLGLLNQRKSRQTASKVQEISVSVDGRLSELMNRQGQLIGQLHAYQVPVPPVPEKPGNA
jgi:hypothetical protein